MYLIISENKYIHQSVKFCDLPVHSCKKNMDGFQNFSVILTSCQKISESKYIQDISIKNEYR